jgi:hypothetical protein
MRGCDDIVAVALAVAGAAVSVTMAAQSAEPRVNIRPIRRITHPPRRVGSGLLLNVNLRQHQMAPNDSGSQNGREREIPRPCRGRGANDEADRFVLNRSPILLALPFDGTWLAQNTPARRVPSHGTHLLGQTYAIDFVAAEGRRTAAMRDCRTVFGVEPVDRFFGFGRPILAPALRRVVAAHDCKPDHEARRSPFTVLPHALTHARRLRQGLRAVAETA